MKLASGRSSLSASAFKSALSWSSSLMFTICKRFGISGQYRSGIDMLKPGRVAFDILSRYRWSIAMRNGAAARVSREHTACDLSQLMDQLASNPMSEEEMRKLVQQLLELGQLADPTLVAAGQTARTCLKAAQALTQLLNGPKSA